MKSFFLIRLLPALTLVLAFAGAARAQPGSGGPAPGAVTSIPVDGGVSLLLAGGVAYGLKQLRNRRKRA